MDKTDIAMNEQRAREREALSAAQEAFLNATQEYLAVTAGAAAPLDLTGRILRHKAPEKVFGAGIVASHTETAITVNFADSTVSFVYPDACVEGILTMLDEADAAAVAADIENRARRSAAEAEMKERQAEYQAMKDAFERAWG